MRKRYMHPNKIQLVIQKELQLAKQQLSLKNHHAARLALSKKKYQEQLLEKTGNQLMTIEQLTQTIEYALVEQDIIKRLELGNRVLEQIHKEMSIEQVEKIMDDTAEGIAYQNEIQEIISKEFTEQDEADIMAQLDALVEQEVLFSNQQAVEKILELPSAPNNVTKVDGVTEQDKKQQAIDELPSVPNLDPVKEKPKKEKKTAMLAT